jgi:hypothetical protein
MCLLGGQFGKVLCECLAGEAPVPVFLVYVVARGAPEAAALLIEDSRLPLLLDLDETLLSACTLKALQRLNRASVSRLTELKAKAARCVSLSLSLENFGDMQAFRILRSHQTLGQQHICLLQTADCTAGP